ncbi:hypothetical protein RIF29_16073 [Crotalaria pallida]|uniref:Uncharacterized protein n=1 Tax=Crotalaria pallida TaxID=3830 RepID=A0AAN9FFS4_CROPI
MRSQIVMHLIYFMQRYCLCLLSARKKKTLFILHIFMAEIIDSRSMQFMDGCLVAFTNDGFSKGFLLGNHWMSKMQRYD